MSDSPLSGFEFSNDIIPSWHSTCHILHRYTLTSFKATGKFFPYNIFIIFIWNVLKFFYFRILHFVNKFFLYLLNQLFCLIKNDGWQIVKLFHMKFILGLRKHYYELRLSDFYSTLVCNCCRCCFSVSYSDREQHESSSTWQVLN